LRKLLKKIETWLGPLLLAGALFYFWHDLLPVWRPRLAEFWKEAGGRADWSYLALSAFCLILGYYFAPMAWRRILGALRIPAIDRGRVRRNWFVTQMGSYIPGRLWMVLGRITFLNANGTGSVKAATALVLENIYLLAALGLLTALSLPFVSASTLPPALIVALSVSAVLGVLMLLAPGIQRLIARKLARGMGTDVRELPHISHRHQAQFIGSHILSWSLRGLGLYFWFRGFGIPRSDPAHTLVILCVLASPASWLASLLMIFIPGGIGVRESVQALMVSSFVPGGMVVATTVALGQRALLMVVEGLFALAAVIHQALFRQFPVRMNHASRLLHLALSVARAYWARLGLAAPPDPINVTFSVTRECQSRCRTCFIWKHRPEQGSEMGTEAVEALFRSIGRTYFFNVSGGEPFLRPDLPEIVRLACRHLRPAVIHIPTNALAPERIETMTREILDIIAVEAPGTVLTVKPSMDGVGEAHDLIRGVPGNFLRLMDTLERLKKLRDTRKGLHVGVGTVISRFNAGNLPEIIRFAGSLGVDTYINEVAEERGEFFNLGSGITPEGADYGEIMETFKRAVRSGMKGMKLLSRITTAMRLVYYDIVTEYLKTGRQVIPCYAALLNVHVNSDGGIWPCAILAYRGQMGSVGDSADFRDVWRSSRARDIRRSIRRKECACPLANQAYSNMLLHPKSLLRVIWTALTG
jgi:MoaA/NifB/PqqE/SkfB family radical SAM enzyme